MSINKAIFSGNLTRDPELRSTYGGLAVLAFGVAVNDRRRNDSGEWENIPNYIDCTMFGKRAEAVAKHLKKGTKVFVEGKLHWSQWEHEGKKRSKIEITIDEIEFLSGGESGSETKYTSQPEEAPVYEPQGSLYGEDIPF